MTSAAPTGKGEAFVLAEIAFLHAAGVQVTIAPVRMDGAVVHAAGQRMIARSLVWPLLDGRAALALLRSLLTRPRALAGVVWEILTRSGSQRRTIKNLGALGKACRLADAFVDRGVTHVHAAWASVPASVAWVISRLTGLPWSFCAIRWDVAEGNMIGAKVRDAAFIRATSAGAAQELIARARVGPGLAAKVRVLPHGVLVPPHALTRPPRVPGAALRIVSVGFLFPKKGHRHLVEACALLRDRGIRFRCEIFGSGPLERDLRALIVRTRLGQHVSLRSFTPLADILAGFESGGVDIVVLPSIVDQAGEREGIPVTLIESLAYGVPVLSTPTGDILELLGTIPEALVPPGDATALADRLAAVAQDEALLTAIARKGRLIVTDRFDIEKNVGGQLRQWMTADAGGAAC